MIDCTIVYMPNSLLTGPPLAPSVLKSFLSEYGLKIKTLDYNNDLMIKSSLDKYTYKENGNSLLCIKENFDQFLKDELSNIIDMWVEEILSLNSRWIGFSLLSDNGFYITEELCKRLKITDPSCKIVIGGSSTKETPIMWKESRIIDEFIIGDGEIPLLNLLKGTNIDKATFNMDMLPIPNYDDYDLNTYYTDYWNFNSTKTGNPTIWVQASRGCVRNCTFCNVASVSPKYIWRKPEKIIKEMVHLNERYHPLEFQLSDNAINGSMKWYKDFCIGLQDIKPDFKWVAHALARKKYTSDDFYMLKDTGCKMLKIGLESGSEKVRSDMKKPCPSEDIIDMVKQCHELNIQIRFMMITGYPTETNVELDETFDLLQNMLKYKNILSFIVQPLRFQTDTPLWDMEFDGLETTSRKIRNKKDFNWSIGDNTYFHRMKIVNDISDYLEHHDIRVTRYK